VGALSESLTCTMYNNRTVLAGDGDKSRILFVLLYYILPYHTIPTIHLRSMCATEFEFVRLRALSKTFMSSPGYCAQYYIIYRLHNIRQCKHNNNILSKSYFTLCSVRVSFFYRMSIRIISYIHTPLQLCVKPCTLTH